MKSQSARKYLFARLIVLFTGMFGLVAQSVLFRDFLTVFEGNEIGIAWFFATWLIWVAFGAFAGKLPFRLLDGMSASFQYLPLVYVPAFFLQSFLISVSRNISGVTAFEIFPMGRMLCVSAVANAPVSICTGFLFTLACQWLAGAHRIPAARVYVLETL